MSRYLCRILAALLLAVAPDGTRLYAQEPQSGPIIESLSVEVRLAEAPKVIVTETLIVLYRGQPPFRALRRAIPERWLDADRNTVSIHRPEIRYVLRDGEPDAFSSADTGSSFVVTFDQERRPLGPSRYRYDLQYEFPNLARVDSRTGKRFLRVLTPGDWSLPIEVFTLLLRFGDSKAAELMELDAERLSFSSRDEPKKFQAVPSRSEGDLLFTLGRMPKRETYAFWLQWPE